MQLRTGSREIEDEPQCSSPASPQPRLQTPRRICGCRHAMDLVPSMSKRPWQSHYFLLTASSADGKDTASVRHHLYKHNDGVTRWELQKLIIGYLDDPLDRAWRPCQVIKENKLTWEVFCLALGLDLHGMAEKSRATVRATRVDDVFDMPCPSQKTRDVLTISTLGFLIV